MEKKPFFKDEEEKKEFAQLANNSNYQRIKIFAPVMILFMAYEIFVDITAIVNGDNESFSLEIFGTQRTFFSLKVYAFIEFLVLLFSAVLQFLSHLYNKNKEKYFSAFYRGIHVYVIALLIISVVYVFADVASDNSLDLIFYYLMLVICSTVFYINPFCFMSGIVISNLLLWPPILIYNLDSEFSPYKPYYYLILIVLCLGSIFRIRHLLDTLRSRNEINRLREQAERENVHKSMFLANMSHEIRTPMNAIVGMSEIAMDYELKDEEKNTIRQIRSSGLALINIINDILDFSKIESGKLEIVPVNYDLFKMLYDSINVAKVKISGKPVEMILEMDPELKSYYTGDNLRLNQILINLIGNAAKFTEKGFIIVRVEKAIVGEEPGIKFSVIDTGCGIREEDMKKLFNAFQQVDMKMNRTKGGTGLGLSISKRLVQLMNGTMNVLSEYGKGSCFYFQIPQKEASDKTCGEEYKQIFDVAEKNSRHPELKNLPLESLLNRKEFSALFLDKEQGKSFVYPKARILVVDDNEVNLQVATGLLKKLEVVPECVSSGFDALKVMKEKTYDVVYLDHQMPVMDGIETLKKIREEEADEKHTTVIALSANAINGAKENFLKNGFDDFVAKPVQLKDFAKSLEKWVPSSLREEKNEEIKVEGIPEGFEVPDASRIDMQSGLDFSGGFSAWLMAAKIFAKTIDEKIQQMRESLSAEDYKNFTIQVHALKSASRVIGATELSGKAQYLETLGNRMKSMFENQDAVKAEIKEKYSQMEELFLSYKEVLKNLKSGEPEVKEHKAASEGEIKEILEGIKDAASQFNLNGIEELLGKLKQLSLDKSLEEKIPALESAVEDIEFEKIAEILG